MFVKRNRLIPLAMILVLVAALFVFSAVVQAATSPPVLSQAKPIVKKPPINTRLLLAQEISVDWVRLNKAIMEGDQIGQSVFNISIKNGENTNIPATKVKISLVALSGGPAPAELSGTVDCQALANGASYAFNWPSPASSSWKAGSYRLTVEADSDKILNDSDRTNNIKTLDFTVLPTQSVRVTDSMGSPLRNAVVSAFAGSTAVQTHTTDFQGTAYFPNLAAGTYKFLATADGYSSVSFDATVPRSTLTIALAKSTLPGKAMIAVRDVRSTPLAGATVSVTVDGAVKTLTSDGNGGALFELLPGTYTFTAAKTGFVTATTTVAVRATVTANGVITLSGSPGGAIITVTDGTKPLSGITVKGYGYNLPEVSQVTNSQGVATFNGIPPANYLFQVNQTGYTPASINLDIKTNTTVSGTITVAREHGDASILVLEDASSYTPLTGATVSVTVDGALQQKTTDASGKVSFTGMPTGDYTFAAAANGYKNTTLKVTVYRGNSDKSIRLARATGGITVTVTDGQESP